MKRYWWLLSIWSLAICHPSAHTDSNGECGAEFCPSGQQWTVAARAAHEAGLGQQLDLAEQRLEELIEERQRAAAESERQRERQHGDGRDAVLKTWWRQPDGRPPVKLVIKRFSVAGVGGPNAPKMRGAFVANDSMHGFKEGDLIGCYAGLLINDAERKKKRKTAPHVEVYLREYNETHFIDPSSDTGDAADTDAACAGCCDFGKHQGPCPAYVQEMPFVNEPSRPLLANAFAGKAGQCRDSFGHEGSPYIAAGDILPGEEVTVCYGQAYTHRNYDTVCSDANIDLLMRMRKNSKPRSQRLPDVRAYRSDTSAVGATEGMRHFFHQEI